jgi:hypothetical protein
MRVRLITIATGLMLIAGGALAQEGAAPPAIRAGAGGAAAARNANAIRPGSMIVAHGQNGFGSAYPYSADLYRGNGGNGFYGPTIGAYFGQFEQDGSL